MATIHSIAVQVLHLPFRQAFKHSLADRKQMESVWVSLHTTSGVIGYGEGTPRGYVTGETLEATVGKLREYDQRLKGRHFDSLDDLHLLLADSFFDEAPSARCALELALLDALGKELRTATLNLFGGTPRSPITYSAVISADEMEVVVPMVQLAAKMGLKQVKLKLGKDLPYNLQLVKLVQDLIPDAEIRADINAGWSWAEALAQMPQLAEAGVRLIEQPLPAAEREKYPLLQKAMQGIAEIMVDESMAQPGDAQWFFDHGGADRFLLKISKQGGILPTLHLANLCAARGIPVHLGCHVGETSVLSAAGRIAAAQFPFDSVEGSFGTLLLEQDITENPLLFGPGGLAPAQYSDAHGLGVEVMPERLSN